MDMQPYGIIKLKCMHIQFQEWKSKLWLFDTLVMLALPYRLETWELRLYKAQNWRDLDSSLVLMIVLMIRSKAPVLNNIIYVCRPIMTKVLFQSETVIQEKVVHICHESNWQNMEVIIVSIAEMQEWY